MNLRRKSATGNYILFLLIFFNSYVTDLRRPIIANLVTLIDKLRIFSRFLIMRYLLGNDASNNIIKCLSMRSDFNPYFYTQVTV